MLSLIASRLASKTQPIPKGSGRYVIELTLHLKSDLWWKKDPTHPGYDPNYTGSYDVKQRGIVQLTINQASITRTNMRSNRPRDRAPPNTSTFKSSNKDAVKMYKLQDTVDKYSYLGVFLITITNITSSAQPTEDYKVIRYGVDNVQNMIDNTYAQAGKACSDANFVPNACVENQIIEKYKTHPRFQTKKGRAAMTHKALYKIATGREYVDDYGLTVPEIERLLKYLNIPFELIDYEGLRVASGKGNAAIPKFRAIIHDGHSWTVSDDMCKSFDSMTRKGVDAIIDPAKIRFTAMIMPKQRVSAEHLISEPDALTQIMDANTDKGEMVVISSVDTEHLLNELFERGVVGGRLRIINNMVESFHIKNGKKDILVVKADGASLLSSNTYKDYLYRIQSILMTADGMSTYSPTLTEALTAYPRTATVINDSKPNEPNRLLVGFDQVKAYSVIQRNLTELPVFNEYDEITKTTEQKTEPFCFYVCSVMTLSAFIAPNTQQFLYYETINYLRSTGVVVIIDAVLRPYKVVRVNLVKACDDLMKEPNLTTEQKKSIMNIVYGQQARKRTTKMSGRLYRNQSAAADRHHYSYKTGALWIGYDDYRADLSSGYVMNSRIILERHAVAMDKVAFAISTVAPIVAINTDCIYVDTEHEDAVKHALRQALYVFNVPNAAALTRTTASLRIEYSMLKGMPPSVTVSHKTVSLAIEPKVINSPALMVDEYDSGEFDTIARGGNILIRGRIPGVGKTHIAIDHMQRTYENGLVITPWNKLASALKTDKSVRTATLHRLLGLNPEGMKIRKGINVDNIQHIHFDEIYLLNVEQIIWIISFIKAHPNIYFSACGDPWQLAPINQTLTRPLHQYYAELLAEVFAVDLELIVSKRITDPAERARMNTFIQLLKDGKITEALAMLERVDLSEMFAEDPEAALALMRYPHVAFTNVTRQSINAAAFEAHGSTLKVGDTLSGNSGTTYKGVRIISSAPYEVLATDSVATTVEFDEVRLTVPTDQLQTYFSYSYCSTVHSVQGCSLGDRLNVWEHAHPMITAQWLLTAASRCGTLSGITLMNACGEEEN